jgi:isoleucyl-tRNA synthetase
MLLVVWNVYKFFVTYANLHGYSAQKPPQINKLPTNVLDKWILSRLSGLIKEVSGHMNAYDTVATIARLNEFVQDLSTWYLRRSRDRDDYYETLHFVLVTFSKLAAPITPFITEELYKNLTGEESVHLSDWPVYNAKLLDEELEKQMIIVRRAAELGHARRKEQSIAVKQPLSKLTVTILKKSVTPGENLVQILKDELNVKTLEFVKGEIEEADFDFTITDDLKQEGEARILVRKIQEERKKMGTSLDEKVVVSLPNWPEKFEEDIKKKALVAKLCKADVFKVDRM